MADTPKSTFENVNELIRTLAWPAIFLLVFFIYGNIFENLIKLVPQKFEQSSKSKFSVGSISFEIEQAAKETGNSELGETIQNLEADAIRELLFLGQGPHSILTRQNDSATGKITAFKIPPALDVLYDLNKQGLIEISEPIDDFLKFFYSLHPITDPESSRKRRKQSEPYYFDLILPVSQLSPEDKERLASYNVRLSESGKKAVDIIVRVTAEQIKKE